MLFKSRYLATMYCKQENIMPDDYCILRSRDNPHYFELYIRSTDAIIDTYITELKFNQEVAVRERIRH